jgi:hypothetical protein
MSNLEMILLALTMLKFVDMTASFYLHYKNLNNKHMIRYIADQKRLVEEQNSRLANQLVKALK